MSAQGKDPVIEELERIHAEYAAKLDELHARQKALMEQVIARLDSEQVAKARESLQNSDIDQEI